MLNTHSLFFSNQRKPLARIRFLFILAGILLCTTGYTEEITVTNQITNIITGVDTLWVLMAAFLVFLMQAGFGMLEAGLIRAKNTANILMKNLMDFSMASLGFFIFGYAIMFGSGNAIFGSSGWFLINAESAADVPLFAFWLFQAVFVGAAATIVAGGMAGRMKFVAYIIYSFLISAFVYPLVGHWIWGGGWLAELGFIDFAGSTVVHAVGGWAVFIGTVILGPRIGKYGPDGKPKVLGGHNLPLASLGMFLLWFGWFGFNPGSTLGVGDGSLIARVAINTNLAAAAGVISATATVWLIAKKPDLTMAMNGALAGLVAITAPCAFVSPGHAILIGLVGGIIVVLGVLFLDRRKIDDPVGAVAVHGMNGIWGTLAIGIWGQSALGVPNTGLWFGGGFTQLGIQALGTFSVSIFIIIVMGIIYKLIDITIGLRVSRENELKGLDIAEHGTNAYEGFQVFTSE